MLSKQGAMLGSLAIKTSHFYARVLRFLVTALSGLGVVNQLTCQREAELMQNPGQIDIREIMIWEMDEWERA